MSTGAEIEELRRFVEPVMVAATKLEIEQGNYAIKVFERRTIDNPYGDVSAEWVVAAHNAVERAVMLVVAQARVEALRQPLRAMPSLNSQARYVIGEMLRAAEALVAQLEESMTSKRDAR